MKKIQNWIVNNKVFSFLLVLLFILIVVALFPDLVAPFDPLEGSLREAFIAPNSTNIAGTDKLGRDIFSRIVYGVRLSLGISLATVSLIVLIGATLGIVAGYIGGVTDKIIMAISNILMSCPSMVLAIALAGIMGASVTNAMFAIFIVTISKYIRLTRSLVIQVTEEEYIKAARICGASHVQILIKHILPNIIQTLIVTASTDIGTIILELSSLSFLGFGVPPPTPELGYMINDGRAYLMSAPWLVIAPGIALFCVVSLVNLVSDKLRDMLA